MRLLPSNALTEIAKSLGTEPITIVAVSWTGGNVLYYGSREVGTIPAKVLSTGAVDSVITDKTGNSISLEVTLDDTDGTIKTLINTNYVHKREAIVYQYFGDLGIDDKFVIFKGEVSSPFTWGEGDRVISFTILSQIEDKEVGFSPEEGQFNFVSPDAVGKPWPLCFGDVVHVPAVKVKESLTGELKDLVCVLDTTLIYKRDTLLRAFFAQQVIFNYFGAVAQAVEALAPPVQTIIDVYCQMIVAERNFLLQALNLIRDLESKKKILDDIKNGRNGGLQGATEALIQQLANDRNNLAAQMFIFQQQKAIVERYAAFAHFKIEVQREAFGKQQDALNACIGLAAQYKDVCNEICRQRRCELDSFGVRDGKDFPQGQLIDIVMKGLKWRGTFSGDIFTGVVGPLSMYRDVPMGSRQVILDDCGEPDADAQLGTFWVSDVAYQMQGNYCLVRSRYDAKDHIIKIIEQDGTKCTFELIPMGGSGNTSGGGGGGNVIVSGDYGIPQYQNPYAQIPNDFALQGDLDPTRFNGAIQNLSAATIAKLGGAPITLDEYNVLRGLEYILSRDSAGSFVIFSMPTPRDMYTIVGEDIESIRRVAGVPLESWYNSDINWEEVPDDASWQAEPGCTVYDAANVCEVYIANILPSEIKAVMAYRTNDDGEEVLTPIPTRYYVKNEAENLGVITVTSLKFRTPLRNIIGEGWNDDVYVTLKSSVGPNVVETLEHIITTYTDKAIDATTFNAIETLFGNKYPANFVLFERRNVLEQLHEIAWQARCAITESNGTFFLKYLSTEPATDATITEADIEEATFSLSLTETEELVTKMVAYWRTDYLPDTERNKATLRYNINRYGLHEREFDFYIYNIQSLVLKSATFWLIRMANTWKRVTFSTFLTQLELETGDCILFDLASNYVASADVKGILESVIYNATDHGITISAWLPVRDGEMVKYDYAWPASLPSSTPFPPPGEVDITINVNGPVGGCGGQL